jgi:ADP-ribosylglycohydrolase
MPFFCEGSYGNGAGMRAHPIALGCYGQPASVLEETAIGVARITHAHKHGITGGLLQTLAVHQVRYLVSSCTGT